MFSLQGLNQANPEQVEQLDEVNREIAGHRDRIRIATNALEELHRARDAEVKNLRLTRVLGRRPPELDQAVIDPFQDREYLALAKQCEAVAADRCAVASDIDTQTHSVAAAEDGLQDARVAAELGTAKPAAAIAAEATVIKARSALEKTRQRLQVLEETLEVVEDQRRTREQVLAEQRVATLESEYRNSVALVASAMRALGWEALRSQQLLDQLKQEPGVRVNDLVPHMIDMRDPQTRARRWLEEVIDAGWVDETEINRD